MPKFGLTTGSQAGMVSSISRFPVSVDLNMALRVSSR